MNVDNSQERELRVSWTPGVRTGPTNYTVTWAEETSIGSDIYSGTTTYTVSGKATFSSSPWYSRTGWLGVKHQVTYLLFHDSMLCWMLLDKRVLAIDFRLSFCHHRGGSVRPTLSCLDRSVDRVLKSSEQSDKWCNYTEYGICTKNGKHHRPVTTSFITRVTTCVDESGWQIVQPLYLFCRAWRSVHVLCVCLFALAAVQWGNADREIMCIRVHCSVT